MGKVSLLKTIVFLIGFLLVFYFVGKIKISDKGNLNGYIVENYIHNSKREVDLSQVMNHDLSTFQLLIDSSDLKSIIVEYGRKTNLIDWVNHKAKLIYNTDTFIVSVTGHADSPSCHKKGNRVSLRFNIQGENKINGVNRFSLVLFDLIGNRAKTLELFSNALDVKMKPSTLVSLLVNGEEYWPMHFEPSTKKFAKKNKLLYKKVNLFKSAVQCYRKSILNIDSIIESDSSLIHPSFRKLLTPKFLSFNKKELSSLAKHLSVQLILNLNGHGLTGENFVFVMDKKTNNFLPIFTRDDIPGVCKTDVKNLKSHYKIQIQKFIEEHGDEMLFSSLIQSQEFVDSVKFNIRSLLNKREAIIDEFMKYNKLSESLYSGKFLDVHFNWRDECEMDERIHLPHISPCMLNHNLDFWSKKLENDNFWNVLKF